jgi:hypothetical protein
MSGLVMSTACAEDEGAGDSQESDTEDDSGTTDAASEEGGGENSSRGEADELDDVQLDKCSKDRSTKWATARLKITNNSSEDSDYAIDVTFESRDGAANFGTGFAYVENLAPGQSKTEEVTSLEEASGKFTCKIESVDRTASV